MNPILVALFGFMVGAGVGSYVTGRRKSKEHGKAIRASDAQWRVAMSNLIGHLLRLGYETIIEDNVFKVDAPDHQGERLLISMHILRFDPETLMEALEDLPPARDWIGHREGERTPATGGVDAPSGAAPPA